MHGFDDKILNLFKEKSVGNDLEMKQEFNALIPWMYEVNNFIIEQITVYFVIFKLAEGIDYSNMHSNYIKKTGTLFREFLCRMFNSYLNQNYIIIWTS